MTSAGPAETPPCSSKRRPCGEEFAHGVGGECADVAARHEAASARRHPDQRAGRRPRAVAAEAAPGPHRPRGSSDQAGGRPRCSPPRGPAWRSPATTIQRTCRTPASSSQRRASGAGAVRSAEEGQHPPVRDRPDRRSLPDAFRHAARHHRPVRTAHVRRRPRPAGPVHHDRRLAVEGAALLAGTHRHGDAASVPPAHARAPAADVVATATQHHESIVSRAFYPFSALDRRHRTGAAGIGARTEVRTPDDDTLDLAGPRTGGRTWSSRS